MTKNNRAPHLRPEFGARAIEADRLIALIPALVMAWLFYGARPLLVCLFTALACLIGGQVLNIVVRVRLCMPLESAVAGMVLALICPATIPFWMPALIGVISTGVYCLLNKLPFFRRFRFSVSIPALGATLLLLIFSAAMLRYPSNSTMSALPLWGGETVSSPSMAELLRKGKLSGFTVWETLLGLTGGPMGGTCIAVLLAAFIYLTYRKSIAWSATAAFMAVYALVVTIMLSVTGGDFRCLFYELCAGGVLFCAIFMVGHFRAAPKTLYGRILYGVVCAVVALCLSRFGLPLVVPPAVVLTGLAARYFDLVTSLIGQKRTSRAPLKRVPPEM